MRNARASEAQKIESSGAQDNSQDRARETGLLAKAAAAKLGDVMAEWIIDPRARVRAIVAWACGLTFHNKEAEIAVAANIANLGPRVKELVERFDIAGLERALSQFAVSCDIAVKPKPVESAEDQVRRYRLGGIFRAKGWGVEEVELVPLFIEPGELLGEVRAAEIKIGDRWVKRATIRERMTSVGMQPSDRVATLEEAERNAVFNEEHPRRMPSEAWGSGPSVPEWRG